ncbi:unnamed protein product [Aphanomyces euteiches]
MDDTQERPRFDRVVNGVAVGPGFNQDGYDAFYNLDFKQDDIVALTYGKCGTTYLQKILYLLTRLDDSGNFPPGYDSSADRRQKLFRKGGNGDWKNFVDAIDKDGWSHQAPTAQ